MTPQRKHIIHTVSKSIVSSAISNLIEQGKLEPGDLVIKYIPELENSAYGDATIRHLLEMSASVKYDPDVHQISAGWSIGKNEQLKGIIGYISSMEKDDKHGNKFQYCNTNTDLLGWIASRITGLPFSEILSTIILSKLGAERCICNG